MLINDDDLKKFLSQNILSIGSIVELINRSLFNLNPKLTLHNEITAYIAMAIFKQNIFKTSIRLQDIYLVSLFHTIGFFRETETYPTDIFSSVNEDKFMFSHYYLKYMTPLGNLSKCLSFINDDYDEKLAEKIGEIYDPAQIIFFSSRISERILNSNLAISLDWSTAEKNIQQQNLKRPESEEFLNSILPADLTTITTKKINPKIIEAFQAANKGNIILKNLLNNSFRQMILRLNQKIQMNVGDTFLMLKFLIYIMDFKSTSTVTHIMNTASYAYIIAKHFKFEGEELNKIFVAALLHDIGKTGIPSAILEAPDQLEDASLLIMRRHVFYTKKILQKIVPDDICEIAFRHHEKLDGSGYPQGLTGDVLTKADRILTVADITSALSDSRSYKQEFSKEQISKILCDMANSKEIDSEIVQYVVENFDEIKGELPKMRQLLQADLASVMQDYQAANLMDIMLFANSAENLDEGLESL